MNPFFSKLINAVHARFRPSHKLEEHVLPSNFRERADLVFRSLDQRLYGMDLIVLNKAHADPKLQELFTHDFGITFEEYLERRNEGEMMGDTQVKGKWLPKRAF